MPVETTPNPAVPAASAPPVTPPPAAAVPPATPPAAEAPPPEPKKGDSLQATVEAAWNKLEKVAEKGAELPAGATPGRTRDPATGQFTKGEQAPKPPASAPPAKQGEQPPQEQPPEEGEAANRFDRAPQSWRGPAKELWRKLPAEFAPLKAEVTRLERERETILRESKAARTVADSLNEVVRPYEGFIRAAGHTPLQTIDGLLRTAATLRTGSAWDKAVLAASVIRAHDINPTWVAAALQQPNLPAAGAQPQPQDGGFRDPRVDQLLADAQAARSATVAEADQKADAELDAFIGQHPLAGEQDVQLKMARAIDLAREDGVDMTFEEAYTGVLAVDPELRAIAEQQDLAKAAATSPTGPTARAEAAAGSVRPSPVTSAPPANLKGRSVEDFVRAAWDKASQRGA